MPTVGLRGELKRGLSVPDSTLRFAKSDFVFPQRSVKREHIVIKWILRVTHMDKNSSIDFADWVQDGVVLSK